MQNIKFPFAVTLAGDSIWDYKGPQTVTVTDISVYTDDDYTSIEVEHDTTWNIYTDSGFEAAISAALGYDVQFTEQGMQQDGVASMET
jgi:beta-mannanase